MLSLQTCTTLLFFFFSVVVVVVVVVVVLLVVVLLMLMVSLEEEPFKQKSRTCEAECSHIMFNMCKEREREHQEEIYNTTTSGKIRVGYEVALLLFIHHNSC